MNYFKLFNITEKFKIDKKNLSQRYHKLQKKFHPDQFMYLDKKKKKEKLKKSIFINKGYKILKSDFLRAQYILSLNGYSLLNKEHVIHNKKFLINQFEISQNIENLNLKYSHDISKLNKIKSDIKTLIKKYFISIENKLNNRKWKKALHILYKLSFFIKKYIYIENIQN